MFRRHRPPAMVIIAAIAIVFITGTIGVSLALVTLSTMAIPGIRDVFGKDGSFPIGVVAFSYPVSTIVVRERDICDRQ